LTVLAAILLEHLVEASGDLQQRGGFARLSFCLFP
jgi:hypothetical protein